MKPKKAAVQPTPCPAVAEPLRAVLEARRAQHAALVAEGCGAAVFHKETATGLAHGKVKPEAAQDYPDALITHSFDESKTRPPQSEHCPAFAIRTTTGTDRKQGAHGVVRETLASKAAFPRRTAREYEATFKARKEQPGPGSVLPPIERENQDLEDKFKAELSKLFIPAKLDMGRKAGTDANKSKADRLTKQVRTIWQSLPDRRRTATVVRDELKKVGETVTARTVNRHLLAMGLRKL